MNLLRCHINGFGRFRDCSFDFRDGLNIVFACNEGGKSTLQRFLVGLLYGQLRSDLRVQRRLDPWVEQYKPWRGADYGGILWCRLANGREVEIHRSFGREETRIEIRASTGEDITGEYEQQRNGEVLFARFHLGMPKQLFESVGIMRENKVTEINGRDIIRDRIANLAQSGDEELSIRQSLARLEQALDCVGSERAPTKPYRQTMDLVRELKSEREAHNERRIQYQSWIEERGRLASQISDLEGRLSRARRSVLGARRREIACRVQSLQEIAGHMASLHSEILSLGANADFPDDKLEYLNQLVGARASIAERLEEVRANEEEAFAQLSRAETERRELAHYATLAASSESEKITEWFVSYLSLSIQKEGAQRSLTRLHHEKHDLEKTLNELGPPLRDLKTDWQRKALEAAEEEQVASEKRVALAEELSWQKAALASAVRSARKKKILAGLSLVLAATPSATRFLLGFVSFTRVFEVWLGLGFVVTAAVLLVLALKSGEARRKAKQVLQDLEAERDLIRNRAAEKRKEIDQAVADSGLQNVDAFLAAARRSDEQRRRLTDVETRLAEAESEHCRLQEQCAEIYHRLKSSLSEVGLSCSPGNLKSQVDLLRTNLRRFRDLDSNYGSCTQTASSLRSDEAELTKEYTLKDSVIRSLLAQAGVDSPEAYREECRKRQTLLELLEKEAFRKREFQRLCSGRTLQEWKDQLESLERESRNITPAPDGFHAGSDDHAPYLPYLPSLAEAEDEEKRAAVLLSSAREEYARVTERVKQAFRNYRSLSEIEEDLAAAESNLGGLDMNRRSLGMALETLESLSRQQQEVLAPQLNAGVEQRFLRLCGQRYDEVKIDPDFQVWVRECSSGELRMAEHLSRGTQDQLYFAMRFGVLDLVSNQAEPCPSLLDEPFAAYDRVRLIEAFKVLREEAAGRQLLLFTCREDIRELALQQLANLIELRDGAARATRKVILSPDSHIGPFK